MVFLERAKENQASGGDAFPRWGFRIGSWIWEVSLLRPFLLLACWRNVVNGTSETDPGPLRDIRAAGRRMEIDLIKTLSYLFSLYKEYVSNAKN